MTAEDDIKALTYDVIPTGSEEEEQQGGEHEANGGITEQESEKEGKETEEGKVEETEKETEEGEKEAKKVEQGEESPKTLEREAAAALTALSTPIKPKQKRKRQTSMYFRARKSTRIKTGKHQPSSKVPITIEDSPSAKVKESPSKTPITYERGTPRSSTWKGKAVLQDRKPKLQGAETVLQETLSKQGDPKS